MLSMTRTWKKSLGILSILAATLALGRASTSGRLYSEAPPGLVADPLVALNTKFHDAYKQARIQKLAEAGPVVVVGSSSLALIRGQSRVEVPFPPAIYQRLKEVAHVPLLTFVLLTTTEGQPFDSVKRAEVGYVSELVKASIESIDRDGFPSDLVNRQRTILEQTRDYLAGVIKDGKAPREALTDYAGRIGPLMLANADDAAAAHLHALAAQMQAWRGELSEQQWRSFHVVIMSAHMARDREIAVQYFTSLLDQPTEGHRLIYAEGLFEESKALDLLGTHLLDGSAATAFFGDPMRLHRDILADGATKALRSMTIRP